MSAVGPHKPTGKPDVCPYCGRPYEYRIKQSDDVFGAGRQYRHHSMGYVFIHEIALYPGGTA